MSDPHTPTSNATPTPNLTKTGMSRRGLLVTTGVSSALAGAALVGPSATANPTIRTPRASAAPEMVKPGDPRYLGLQTGNNQRFVATPDYVFLVRSTADTVRAVQHAADAGKRVSVRGGGHCFEDFVCNPEIEVIVDTSLMNTISYDEQMQAFEVGPGAELLDVYETLNTGWGVTLPGGICYSVGVGGHVAGGGYGLLSRSHGLVVDHLYGVEVVVLDARGRAKAVVATRDDTGDLADLWWAHTGGGGGNFGVVTRYWFRSANTEGKEPGRQLPAAPEKVLVSTYDIAWDQLDEQAFQRVVANFGAWHEKHKAPGTPESHLSSLVNISHSAHGSLGVFTQIDASVPSAAAVVDDYNRALLAGTSIEPRSLENRVGELPPMPDLVAPQELPWIQATKLVGTNNPTITSPTSRGMHKSAYFNSSFTAEQTAVLYEAMTKDGFTNPDTMLVMFSFGGMVNAVPDSATANVQRNSAFKICLQTFWPDAADDDYYAAWERETFSGMFRGTGGVPVPGAQTDGCYINYPDKDMRDPEHNTSGVPWSTLYYKGNYPRLQQAKGRWDPTDFFCHSLSIELPKAASAG